MKRDRNAGHHVPAHPWQRRVSPVTEASCADQGEARKEALLTAEQFAALPDDPPSELVRGRLVRQAHPGYPHARLQTWLGYLLTEQIESHGWPVECGGTAGCLVEEGPDTVRGADLVVVRTARAMGRANFVAGGPELAIEILSPSNRRGNIQRKIREYLAAGSERVWVLDPKRRTVTVHRAGAPPVALKGADRLDAGTLMPDLTITVEQVFRSRRPARK